MVVAKTLAAAIPAGSPRRYAAIRRTGKAPIATSRPRPWLTLFAISSPRDCGRSGNAEIGAVAALLLGGLTVDTGGSGNAATLYCGCTLALRVHHHAQ